MLVVAHLRTFRDPVVYSVLVYIYVLISHPAHSSFHDPQMSKKSKKITLTDFMGAGTASSDIPTSRFVMSSYFRFIFGAFVLT
jgi:hypothetical protein